MAQRLGCFCSDQGLGAPALSTEVVEAFVSVGLVGRASSTRGTYRSVLRALGGPPVAWWPPALPALRPRRPIAVLSGPSFCPWPAPSAAPGAGTGPWPWSPSASGPGYGPANWPR